MDGTRSRMAYQAVPADHPALLELLAAAPAMTPEAEAALDTLHFPAMEGRTLLAFTQRPDPDGGPDDAEALLRDDATGGLSHAGWSVEDDPPYGCVGIGDIAEAAERALPRWYGEDVVALVRRMADSPWVDGRGGRT